MPNISYSFRVPTVEECLANPSEFSVTFDGLLGCTLQFNGEEAAAIISFEKAVKCACAIHTDRVCRIATPEESGSRAASR